jgi:hypothetical protein
MGDAEDLAALVAELRRVKPGRTAEQQAAVDRELEAKYAGRITAKAQTATPRQPRKGAASRFRWHAPHSRPDAKQCQKRLKRGYMNQTARCWNTAIDGQTFCRQHGPRKPGHVDEDAASSCARMETRPVDIADMVTPHCSLFGSLFEISTDALGFVPFSDMAVVRVYPYLSREMWHGQL